MFARLVWEVLARLVWDVLARLVWDLIFSLLPQTKCIFAKLSLVPD